MSTSRRTWVLLCTSALPGVSEGLRDLRVGSDVLVITWLDRARRDVLVS
jgi:tRNA (Thr-GGU) A37 N-methylase